MGLLSWTNETRRFRSVDAECRPPMRCIRSAQPSPAGDRGPQALAPRGRISAQNAPRSGINHLVRKGLAPKKKPSLGTLHQISDNSSRRASPDPEYCDPFVGGAAFTLGAAQQTARRPLPRTRDGFRNIFPLRGFPTYILVRFVDQRLLARTVVTSRQGEDDVDVRKTAGFS